MVLICFLLDLHSLSPPLLHQLKQSLLELANFYALWRSSSKTKNHHRSESIEDRIGLCYVHKNQFSLSNELKIAHCPRGRFSLRGFHHAVNNLPTDAFVMELDDSRDSFTSSDLKLSGILSDQVIYAWGCKDIMKKVIVLSSRVPDNIDSVAKKTLAEAADKCVSVEFLMFEHTASHISNIQDNVNCFARSVSDLDNCLFRTYFPERRVFHGLVKRWLQDLKDDTNEPLQVCFRFHCNIFGSLNQISCSLSSSVTQIIEGFDSCEACQCHGSPLNNKGKDEAGQSCCPVSANELNTSDVIEHCVRVGDNTVLFVPSYQSSMIPKQVSSPIEFNVIERTNLNSLSEGVIFGHPYFVCPSASHEIECSSDEMDQLNSEVFEGIRNAMHKMDQGLVCSSTCNVETMRDTSFICYYILQPSENGPMLLRRLAGSEEVLPIPDMTKIVEYSINEETQNSIQSFLLKMDLTDYNPVLHESNFHQKLNLMVNHSVQFGSISPKQEELTSKQNSSKSEYPKPTMQVHRSPFAAPVDLKSPKIILTGEEDNPSTSIAEEWELLVVDDAPRLYSPTCITNLKTDRSALSPPDGSSKKLDEKTSRILERLELPKQLRTKVVSPTTTSSRVPETNLPKKVSLIPFQSTDVTGPNVIPPSQLMKPNFQRLKRKHK